MQKEHVGPHAIGQPVIDWPDLEIDGLDAAEGTLHQAQGFVAAHCGGVVESAGGQAGAHDVEAVEGRFRGDFVGLAGKAEAGIGNVEGEVLGLSCACRARRRSQGRFQLCRAAAGASGRRRRRCGQGRARWQRADTRAGGRARGPSAHGRARLVAAIARVFAGIHATREPGGFRRWRGWRYSNTDFVVSRLTVSRRSRPGRFAPALSPSHEESSLEFPPVRSRKRHRRVVRTTSSPITTT